MPHLIIEYSANVAERVDIPALVDAVHDAVLDTGVAPPDGLRTRAVAREHYAIADRHPDNGFVAVTARFGHGRTEDDRGRVIEAVLAALHRQLGDDRHRLMLSVEYQEIDPSMRINENHVRPFMAPGDEGDV